MGADFQGRHARKQMNGALSLMRRTLIVVLAVSLIVFFGISLVVTTLPLLVEPIDEQVFNRLRGRGSVPPWFNEAVRDVSSLGSLSILIGISLIAVAYLLLTGRSRAAFHVTVAAAAGIALGMGLKVPFDRARPDLALHGSQVFTRSFPSAHGTVSAAVLLTLGGLIARHRSGPGERLFILGVTGAIILLIGASRIYLGVHWPSDVLAGWALGTAWACACWLMLARQHEQAPSAELRNAPDE
jgi:undecaprenyl-diphosphatase